MSSKAHLIFLLLTILTHSTQVSASIATKRPAKLDRPIRVIKGIQGGNPKARAGGTLTYEFYEPNHINPITFRQAGSREILINWVFQTLLDTDAVTGEDIPGIASKWAISENGKVFTFWIDKRAKWFDGKSITTSDVKFSFDVYSMPGTKSAFRKAQAQAFSKIEIVSPKVIRFHAKKRIFSNFEFLISTLILPKHLYYHKDPKRMARNKYTRLPKGSGPYLVESWKKGDRCILKKNPNFWASKLPQNIGAYNFDTIVIKYIRDPQMAFENLKKGSLDYMPIRIGNTELWRQTKTDRAFTSGNINAYMMRGKVQNGYGFIGLNLKNELFSNKKVRKALLKAINREEMIKKSLDGLATVPRGPLFSNSNFNGTYENVEYDPQGALADLSKLGWRDSDGDYILDKDGKKFTFTVIVPNARIEKEMLFVQEYWKQIGVIATVKMLEYSTWRQLQDERKFDAVSNGKSRAYKSRKVNPYGEWHSDNISSGLRNYYGYANKKVDNLINQGLRELNQFRRKKIFDRVNDIIASDHVMLQYSEAKYSLLAVNSKIVMPEYRGKKWFPYDLGMKYWYRK